MLCLSRKKNQSIVIGDIAEVFVIEIGQGQVRLGIRADAEVPVHRREIYDAIQRADGEDKPRAA